MKWLKWLRPYKSKQRLKIAESLALEHKKAKEEASRVKSNFLANMSHELRTPLNTILGYSEMLLEDAKEQKLDNYADNLNKIIYSGRHLLGLINDILDMSQLETGKMFFSKEKYSLTTLANELESYIKPLIQKNDNKFTLKLYAPTEDIYTDISRVRRILINLLDNANKFTKNGQIMLDIRTHHEWVEFKITDSGVGISKTYFDKLFQDFSQADPGLTRKYGGVGLGLYLTKRICEQLEGTIVVESEEGKGSVFTLTFPSGDSLRI